MHSHLRCGRRAGMSSDGTVEELADRTQAAFHMLTGPRHSGGSNLIFADGHAKWNTLDRTIFPKILWSRSKSPTDPLSDTRNFQNWGGCR
jgi:prepilin-type processing-associated H-X9-DG protein